MLTAGQQRAEEIVLAGHNLCLTGQAGTGKTFLIKEICRKSKEQSRRVTLLCTTGMVPPVFGRRGKDSAQKDPRSKWRIRRAPVLGQEKETEMVRPRLKSSGLAKTILQGTMKGKRRGRQKKRCEDNIKEWTKIDFGSSATRAADDRASWAGLYDGRYGNGELKNLVLNDDKYQHVRDNVKETDFIIIDEVSMLSLKDFEQLELVCRTVKDNELYFGGLQILASGDFYQLPPVPNYLYNDYGNFCFQSEIWQKVLCHRVNLVEVVRQTEPELVRAVRETALGNVSTESDAFLKSLSRPLPPEVQPVHLFSRNLDTALFNADKLQDMDGESSVYKATKNTGSEKYLKKILAPKYLQLKIGSPVILLRNLGGQLVNGLSGTVKSLDTDFINVNFQQIQQAHRLTRYLFSIYNPRTKQNIAEREQFPLTLGFAITMHKAQGMTLDAAEVNCRGIFQAGQMSVGIGRMRSSSGLKLVNYRAGLCQQHKSCVTEFTSPVHSEMQESLDCCRRTINLDLNNEVNEENAGVYESDDSDLDNMNSVDIESIDDLQLQLPDYINEKELINLVKVTNPVTETQRRINAICQTIDPTRLYNYCLKQHINISKLLPETTEKKTTPKIWSAMLSNYHTYISSSEYRASVSELFETDNENPRMYIATKIVFEIVKREIENLCANVETSSNQFGLPRAEISEGGKAKVRHVGGMCVVKANHHFMSIVTSNIGNPSKKAMEKVTFARQKVHILQHLEADIDEIDFDLDSSLEETERKMNIRRGLTHITNSCFSFFLVLNQHIRNRLDLNSLKEEKEDLLEKERKEIADNEELQMIWAELFPAKESTDLVFDVYKNVTERYMKVCYKQFLKETKDCLNVQKKKAHREEIAKKKEEQKTAVPVSMKEILEDQSLNMESSHLKLKLNVMSNKEYLRGKEFTKTNLLKLCAAYDIKKPTGIKKEELAKELSQKILSTDMIPNTAALNCESLCEGNLPEHSVCKKRRRNAKAPGKGKGRGKGKSAVIKYYCGLCKEEYLEEEEWIQCFSCDKWFHRSCGEIDNEEDWQDIINEVTEWLCLKCLR